ncbi:MAG TPA: RNA polymerase sigma factor [Thermoanaerobaculia bacterium]|nr:RNA polymerase sigma factor [Thermoanaerobaculia bacterium]
MDDAQFEAIYRQFYGRVYRFFRKSGVADSEAHDLAQDAFKRLYEHKDRIRGPEPWPFLKTIARTTLLNYVRARHTSKRNAKIVEIDDPETHDDLPQTPEPDHAQAQQDALRRESLGSAIRTLSEAQQQVLHLQLEGLSYEEIAAALNISVDAVKSRRRDALRLLRERMRGEPGGFEWPGADPEEER